MVSLEVEILGKKYRFRSDNPDKITECASHLNSLLDEITSKYGIIDGKDILVLAAMDLTDKLFQLTEESREMRHDMQQLTRQISAFFGEVLNK